jgi:hypothetical protein
VLLEKWQGNAIFEAIQEAGLDPGDFDFENSETEARISRRGSESYFIIGGGAGHYEGSYVVGDGPAWPYKVYSWPPLMERVGTWAASVRRDLETPDLWAEFRRAAESLGVAADAPIENTPFTEDEQRQIEGRLQELKEYVRTTYSLSGPQMQAVDAKLDYLVDASRRPGIGRSDWQLMLYGAVLGWILQTVLPPDVAKDILLMALRGLGQLLGYHIPELPSG